MKESDKTAPPPRRSESVLQWLSNELKPRTRKKNPISSKLKCGCRCFVRSESASMVNTSRAKQVLPWCHPVSSQQTCCKLPALLDILSGSVLVSWWSHRFMRCDSRGVCLRTFTVSWGPASGFWGAVTQSRDAYLRRQLRRLLKIFLLQL